GGVAVDALEQGGPLPGVGARVRRSGRRRGLAHEALERGDHGGGLLGRGARRDDLELRAAVGHRRGETRWSVPKFGIDHLTSRSVPTLPVLDRDAVYAAVSPQDAIERVRDAFVRHHRGEWRMPAKVYLDSPPHGDFRAMPALGGDLAMLKWISSFPGNPREHALPAVIGLVCLSDAGTSEPLALLDAG